MKFVVKETPSVITDFQKHVMRISWLKSLIPMGLILTFGIVSMLTFNFVLGIAFITFSIVFSLLLPITQSLANSKLNKSSPSMMEEKQVEYEFNDDSFSVTCYKQNALSSSSIYYYNQLYKVDENKKYLYLYLAMNQALPITKGDIGEENTRELIDLLQTSVLKYKKF